MKHLFLTPFLFAILLLAGNCRKSEISFESNNSNNNSAGFSISGKVLDKDNVPISQAEVKAGNVTTRTDADGYFILNNVKVPTKTAFVKVEKSGYFQGSRTFIAHNGAINYVNIRLIPKSNNGNFSATAGGTVSIASGSTLNFQPNSIVDASNNTAYSGSVTVSAFFIDPSETDFITIMPGDLRGVTTTGEERGLQSFGMMAVELTGSSGQKLQLANGKPATLNFNIPAALLSKAPATIPLWYFDELTGLWKEEGSATKQGDKYVGNVNHFSFWNCDAPFPVIELEAVVRDQHGYSVVDALVTITRLDNGAFGTGKTDDAGRVSGKIPANAALEIKVTDRCNNELYKKNIGPYSTNVNLGIITVNIQAQATVIISGTAVNCNNAPVTNGFANIRLDGLTYRANINNGNFSISIIRCNGNPVQAEIFAEDINSNQQGSSKTITVSSGNLNAGQLSACGVSTDQYVNYTLDGVSSAYTSPTDSLGFYYSDSAGVRWNALSAYTPNGARDLYMDYRGNPGPGTFSVNVTVIEGATKYEGSGLSATISQYGNPGQFVIGTFSGTVTTSTGTPKTITSSFKVRRRM
jgi:hypothetical protein